MHGTLSLYSLSPQLKIITSGDQHNCQPVMVVHIISLGLTAFVLYLSAPGTDLFSWHPSLMTVAFALLLSQVGFYIFYLHTNRNVS